MTWNYIDLEQLGHPDPSCSSSLGWVLKTLVWSVVWATHGISNGTQARYPTVSLPRLYTALGTCWATSAVFRWPNGPILPVLWEVKLYISGIFEVWIWGATTQDCRCLRPYWAKIQVSLQLRHPSCFSPRLERCQMGLSQNRVSSHLGVPSPIFSII